VRLTNDALRLGVRIVQTSEHQKTKAGRAMVFLATRMLNEVRACEMLAQSGYPLQSLALGASAFELAYRALYVADDESRAEEWSRHVDLRYSYPKDLKAAMREVYRRRGQSAAHSDLIYQNRYRPLAAAKHANPRALSQFGYARAGDTLHIFLGPAQERATIKACQIALVECVRLLGMVLDDLVSHHMPGHEAAFRGRLNALARRAGQLGMDLQK